jgi:hypothetical protein
MINTKSKIFISHRGNITGPNSNTENTPEAIEFAISMGYDCEIDVWYVDDVLYLGHDFHQNSSKEKIDKQFFSDHFNKLWIHCKNCFFHDEDRCTLTSKGYLWTYPGCLLTSKSICVLPEWGFDRKPNILDACGICSDYIERYENEYK